MRPVPNKSRVRRARQKERRQLLPRRGPDCSVAALITLALLFFVSQPPESALSHLAAQGSAKWDPPQRN